MSFSALQPWVACALMFTVLMTLDLTASQIRMLVLAFIIGVTFSVAIGLIGGVKPPTETSAIRDDGRLRGGLDDPNYLAAGIVPVDRDGGGPACPACAARSPPRARRDGRDPAARPRRPPSRAAG